MDVILSRPFRQNQVFSSSIAMELELDMPQQLSMALYVKVLVMYLEV